MKGVIGMDTITIHCPTCGEEIECKKTEVMPTTGITFYEGECKNCEHSIVIENRSFFDQEGVMEIIFR